MENDTIPSDSQHVRAYMQLRRSVGWIGVFLPLLLMTGNAAVFGGDLVLPSLSRYYFTGMRDVFVGGLCAMGMFLFYYSGHDAWEDWAGNVAGGFALLVAFFPTVESGPLGAAGIVHYASAIALFLVLGACSFFLFSRQRPHSPDRTLALVHRICGAMMFLVVVGIAVFFIVFREDHPDSYFAFVVETVALWSFGVSWLIEGRALEKDK